MTQRSGIDAHESDEPSDLRGYGDERQQLGGFHDDGAQVLVGAAESIVQITMSLATLGVALDDAHAFLHGAQAGDVDAQPEAIQQLRPQLALVRIHGAGEDEGRRVRERDAFALDGVAPHRSGIEEHVDYVVVEQVHLVDVEDAVVGIRKHTRLEHLPPFLDRRLRVQRADHAIF